MYKEFCMKNSEKSIKFESREHEMRTFSQNFKDIDKNALKVYMSYRYPVDESNSLYLLTRKKSEDILEAQSPVKQKNAHEFLSK